MWSDKDDISASNNKTGAARGELKLNRKHIILYRGFTVNIFIKNEKDTIWDYTGVYCNVMILGWIIMHLTLTAYVLSCIWHVLLCPVLLPTCTASDLYFIWPVLHPYCPASELYCIWPAFLLYCIRPVLHPSCLASHLSCIRPVLHRSCPASVMSCIHPVMHPFCPASVLSCIWSVLHLICPASDLSCIWSVLHPSCTADLRMNVVFTITNFLSLFLPELFWHYSKYSQNVFSMVQRIEGKNKFYILSRISTNFRIIR